MDYKTLLEKNNRITYKILNNSIINNKISHSYIFSSQTRQNIENEYLYLIQNLIKKGNDFNPLHYSDLILIDGSNEFIKKEQVLLAIDKFQETSLDEVGIKILLIKNVENSNPQSLNSLLKFIEEPTKNTYIIMTTNNIVSLLSTIKSRSQIISVPPINMENWINEIKKLDIKNEYVTLLAHLFKTKKEINKNFNSDFKDNYFHLLQILENGIHNKNDLFIEFKKFINKKNYKIILLCTNLFFNDIWKKQQMIELSYPKEKNLINKYIESSFDYKKAIEKINDFFLSIDHYVNFELSKINLLLELEECYV